MPNSFSSIKTILTLDDKKHTRDTLAFPIEMADRTPIQLPGPLGTLSSFLAQATSADAAITDYQLRPGHYASFDGDELVAAWYRRGFPAILCTSFAIANIALFRRYRRWIPVVMSPEDLNPDSLMDALELTSREIHNDFSPARRPWRAVVRFVEFNQQENIANAIVSGWGEEVIALRASDLEAPLLTALQSSFRAADEFRCFATANLGAESNGELYVTDWEV